MNPPSSSAARSKQTRLKPEVYLPLEDLVRRLYLVENKTTQDIAKILEQESGIPVTNSQVIHLVNKVWSLRKRLTPSDHEFIEHIKRKREDEGKLDTRIKLCGVVHDEDRLARKKSRLHEPTFQKLAKAHNNMTAPNMASPINPSGLEVGTPTPRPISECSPIALARSPQHSSPPFYFTINHLYEELPSLKLEIVFQSITTRLQGAPTPVPFSPGSLLSMSKNPALLSIPEINTQDSRVSRIVSQGDSSPDEELLEVLRPLVVKCGNRGSDPGSLRAALDKFTESNISPRYYATLEAFFSNVTPIIDDFAVQTFYSAARTGNINLLKFFIELGILKASRKSRWFTHAQVIGVTALQFSIEYREGPSTSLLLRSGIDVNIQPVSDLSQSVLKTAVEVQDLELVNQLFDMGAEDIVFEESYGPSPIREKYLQELKENGLTWVSKVSGVEKMLDGPIHTALFSAIGLEDDDIFKTVLDNRTARQESGKPPIPFDSLSHLFIIELEYYLIYRQKLGRARIFERLRSILECDALHIDINGIDVYGRRALDIARSRAKMCLEDPEQDIFAKILVSYGADTASISLTQHQPQKIEVSSRLPLFRGVSPTRLCRILDDLRSLASHFEWASYRQSLEPFAHLDPNISLGIVLTRLSSSPHTSFECDLKISFKNPVDAKTLKSIETINGSLHPYIDLRGERHVYIPFHGYGNATSLETFNLERYDVEVDVDGVTSSTDTKQRNENAHPEKDLYPNSLEKASETIYAGLASKTGSGRLFTATLLHQARQSGGLEHQKQLIAESYSNVVSEMESTELAALLALAIHANSHKTIREITPRIQRIDKVSLLEATWNGDNATFDLILDLAQHTDNLGISFELLILIAIHIGHTYKVIRLLDQGSVDVNHVLEGGTNFLETAAALGRLDITQVLLNAGASDRLPEAKAQAEKFGHFALSHIINERIKGPQPNENIATPSDIPTPASVLASNGPPAEIPTPVPIAAESPRDPIVHEYGLYMSSDGLQEMLSSAGGSGSDGGGGGGGGDEK
ncbi:hypothetical protein TWF506_007762 [Arthrobotrys conoides]|uniref:Clr5 domain-containing protein n=1 Tax=Arthrobotrys conoides TaxID=74498 RepID=A0AAN8RZV5_9PEZI